jgi:hypothetical protein
MKFYAKDYKILLRKMNQPITVIATTPNRPPAINVTHKVGLPVSPGEGGAGVGVLCDLDGVLPGVLVHSVGYG